MKKERYIYFIFILFIVVNFISCKNFLNGSDTKNKLDEYINYVNDTNPLIIKNVFPEYISEGVYKTTPIRIQFNKPIDTSTFKYNFSNSNEYFDEPVYSNSNRVVTFFPKIDNDEKFTFLDVTLVIDDNIKSSSGTKIHLENNEYKIRYNNSVDKIKPVINNIEISKDRDFEHNSLSQNNSMFNDNDDDELSKYRINKLWIKAKGIDYNNGIKEIKVTETLIKNIEGKDVLLNGYINQKCEDVVFNLGENNYTYETEFEYKFGIEEDGILKLDFVLSDGNNESDEVITYYILKDTKVYENGYFLYNNIPSTGNYEISENNNIDFIKSEMETIYLLLTNDCFYKENYKKYDDNRETIILKSLEYKFEEEFKSINYTKYDSPLNYEYPISNHKKEEEEKDNYYMFNIPECTYYFQMTEDMIELNKTADIEFRITLEDDLGNISVFTEILPKQVSVINYYCSNEYIYNFYFNDNSVINKYSLITYMCNNLPQICIELNNAKNQLEKDLNPEGSIGQKYIQKDEDKDNDYFNNNSDSCNFDIFLIQNYKYKIYKKTINEEYKYGLNSIPDDGYNVRKPDNNDPKIIAYTYEMIPGEINSGKTDIVFKLDEEKFESDTTYMLYCGDDADFNKYNIVYFNSSGLVTYSMDSLSIKYFKLKALKNGKIEEDVNTKKIFTTFDNISFNYNSIDEDSFNTLSIPRKIMIGNIYEPIYIPDGLDELASELNKLQQNFGFKSNDDGKTTPAVLWLSDKYYGETSILNANDFSKLYLKNELNIPLENLRKTQKNYFEFYIPGAGKYYPYLQLTDANGNCNQYPVQINELSFEYYNLEQKPKYSVTIDSGTNLKITGSLETKILLNDDKENIFEDNVDDLLRNSDITSKNISYSFLYQTYDDHIKNQNKFSVSLNNLGSVNTSAKNYEIENKINKDVKDEFVYVYVLGDYTFYKGSKFYGRNKNLYSVPFIFYLDNSNKYDEVKSKKLIDVSTTAMAVSSNAPVLVHTLYNNVNFEDDIDSWLRYSAESNPQVFMTNDFYEIESTEIPNGCYYCVIAHFADGSTKIGSVYKK